MPSRPPCSSAFWTRQPGPCSSRRGLAPVEEPGSAPWASPGLAPATHTTSAANSASAGRTGEVDFLFMPLHVRVAPNVAPHNGERLCKKVAEPLPFMRLNGVEPSRVFPPTRPSTLRVYQFRHSREGGGHSRDSVTFGARASPAALRASVGRGTLRTSVRL